MIWQQQKAIASSTEIIHYVFFLVNLRVVSLFFWKVDPASQ
jgi:hypothetical protein